MLSYAAFPFAAIPMTYVLSFVFPTVASAQTFTLFYYFLIGLCVPSVTYYLRFMEEVFTYVEIFARVMKFVPGFCFGYGLFFNGL